MVETEVNSWMSIIVHWAILISVYVFIHIVLYIVSFPAFVMFCAVCDGLLAAWLFYAIVDWGTAE